MAAGDKASMSPQTFFKIWTPYMMSYFIVMLAMDPCETFFKQACNAVEQWSVNWMLLGFFQMMCLATFQMYMNWEEETSLRRVISGPIKMFNAMLLGCVVAFGNEVNGGQMDQLQHFAALVGSLAIFAMIHAVERGGTNKAALRSPFALGRDNMPHTIGFCTLCNLVFWFFSLQNQPASKFLSTGSMTPIANCWNRNFVIWMAAMIGFASHNLVYNSKDTQRKMCLAVAFICATGEIAVRMSFGAMMPEDTTFEITIANTMMALMNLGAYYYPDMSVVTAAAPAAAAAKAVSTAMKTAMKSKK